MEEIWKDVKGYDGYQVSNMGRVRSIDRKVKNRQLKGKILTGSLSKLGYRQFYASGSMLYFHRCVAIAFIPNPENKKSVNHKNFDRLDNRVDNLEWMSLAENTNHQRDNGRIGTPTYWYGSDHHATREVMQLTMEGKEIATFESITEATKVTGAKNISAVCRGIRRKSGGYIWKYC
jgi:hypothetical protein